MSLDVLMAAIRQREALNPSEYVSQLFISHAFNERLKSDRRAILGVELLNTTDTQYRFMGYPCTFEEMQPDFRIEMSLR
jgi:hypothetical protein